MKKQTKKPLNKWLDVDLFFAPELFKDAKKLPFIKIGKDGVWESHWSVASTGDYGNDYELGKYYALLFLAHNDYQRQTGGDSLSLLRLLDIVKDMPKRPTDQKGYTGHGLETGFLNTLSERLTLANTWERTVTSGLEITLNRFTGRRGDKPLKNDPFAIAEKNAIKKKAADERAARALAKVKSTPANLKKLSSRLKRAKTSAEMVSISREIEHLKEPHKSRLREDWTAKAPAFILGGDSQDEEEAQS